MKLYLITFISLLLSLVAKGQTNGLNGGTIRPLQTITEVTSSNGSVNISNPYGPIVDLSATNAGGGGTIVSNNIVNINTTNGNVVITNGGITISTTNGGITITNNGGGLVITNGSNIFIGTTIITSGYFGNVTISNSLIYNTTLSNVTFVGGTVFSGAISNLTATPNQVAWWDGNQSLVSTNILSASSINGVDLTNATWLGGTNIIDVTNLVLLNNGAISWPTANTYIGLSNGFLCFGNGSGIFGFGSMLGQTTGTILAETYYGNNFYGGGIGITNLQSTNINFTLDTNITTYLGLYDGAGNIGMLGWTNKIPNFGTNVIDTIITNGLCFTNGVNLSSSNLNWITYYLHVTNPTASYPISFNNMVVGTNLLGGLTNGYILTNGVWTLEVFCVGTNILNERWYLIGPNGAGNNPGGVSLAVDGVTLVTNTFGTASTRTNITFSTINLTGPSASTNASLWTNTTSVTTNVGPFWTNYIGASITNISFGNTNIYSSGVWSLFNSAGSNQITTTAFAFTNGANWIRWDGVRLNVGGAYNFSPTGFTNLTAALTFYNFGNNSTVTASNFQGATFSASTAYFGTFVTTNANTNQLVWGRDTYDGAGNLVPSGGVNVTNGSINFNTNLYFWGSLSNSMCWSNFIGLLPNQVAFTRVIFYSTNAQNGYPTFLSFASNNTLNITPHNWAKGYQLPTYAAGSALSLYEMDVLAFISAGGVTNVIMELKPPTQSIIIGDGTYTSFYGACLTNTGGGNKLEFGANIAYPAGICNESGNVTISASGNINLQPGGNNDFNISSSQFFSRVPYQFTTGSGGVPNQGIYCSEINSGLLPPQFFYITSNKLSGTSQVTMSNYMGTFAQTNTVTISTAGMLLSNAWFIPLGNGTNGILSWKFHIQGTDKKGAEMCETVTDGFVVFSNCPPNYAVSYFSAPTWVGPSPTLTATCNSTGAAISCTDLNTDPVSYTIDGTARWTWKQ